SANPVAMAASIAFPPLRRTSAPTSLAIWFAEATIALVARASRSTPALPSAPPTAGEQGIVARADASSSGSVLCFRCVTSVVMSRPLPFSRLHVHPRVSRGMKVSPVIHRFTPLVLYEQSEQHGAEPEQRQPALLLPGEEHVRRTHRHEPRN